MGFSSSSSKQQQKQQQQSSKYAAEGGGGGSDNHTVHSQFGDAYSVKSRGDASSYMTSNTSYDDNSNEPRLEADYDKGATKLYRCIEDKDWDGALQRIEVAPAEAATWVSRREHNNSHKLRWRLLPLHAVCIFRAPLQLIEALIAAHPLGPRAKDDQGMLPIHLACRNGASKGVVLTLLTAYPESVDILDRKNRSLIHLVENSNSNHKDSVIAGIERFRKEEGAGGRLNSNNNKEQQRRDEPPAAMRNHNRTNKSKVNEVDYDNRTVLFRLILKKDWKAVVQRAKAFPGEAETWIVTKGFNGNLRFLPLHKACVLQPPESVINELLFAYPEGASDKDQDGWLPVHCACFYGASENIVNVLLTANPAGAMSKDDDGRLPLHYACLKGSSQGVVDVLLASYAKAAMSKDDEGRLPVHHACSKGAPESVIDALLKASPKGAQSKDDQGRLPLHHACRKNASERVIRTLLLVYPRATQIKDDQDKLPIHYACQHGTTPSVATLLLTTYPESIHAQNGFGSTPLVVAKETGENNPKMEPVIKVLAKFKKEQDKIRGNDENANVESKVAALELKVGNLEKTLIKVSLLGKEIKHAVRKKKDPNEILEKFAEELLVLTRRSKTPMKHRQATTPSSRGGGLFGRNKSKSSSSNNNNNKIKC